MNEEEKKRAITQVSYLMDAFEDAKEYGSILHINQCDWCLLHAFVSSVEDVIQLNFETVTVIANARVYAGKNNSLDITYKKPISKDFSDDDVQRGLIHIQSGELFGASLMNRIPTLYYDGIRCFLYQGICDALELKCEGININHRRERLFN